MRYLWKKYCPEHLEFFIFYFSIGGTLHMPNILKKKDLNGKNFLKEANIQILSNLAITF